MLRAFYKKQGKQVPEAILSRFRNHDDRGNYRSLEEPAREQTEIATQTQDNPQAMDGPEP